MSTQTRAFAVDGAIDMAIDANSGDDGFSWSEANIVQIDHPPHETAFDTDRFYKIPLTAARPVEQTYQTVDGEVVMKKPAEELQTAAWSLDNAPLTLGHPSSRIVDAVDTVHGFTRNPTWDSTSQSLDAHAYVPVTDTTARAWIEDNDGVSIGFWYEADTDVDGDTVDAYQRQLLVDHVAVVDEGRCSREDGCGLGTDATDAMAIRGFDTDVDRGSCSDGACSCGLHLGVDRPTEDFYWTDDAKVSFDHQMGRRSVTVDMATAPAPFYIALHEQGTVKTRQNVSVGEQLGRSGPYDAYEEVGSVTVDFDEPIAESRQVYALLYFATESGDMGRPIEGQQGFVFDSAVVMPDTSSTLTLTGDDITVDVAPIVNSIMSGDGSFDVDESFATDERTVAGVTFDGLRNGKLDESEIPDESFASHYLYPGDTKSESSYPVVDGDNKLRRGNVDAAHSLGARGGVDDDEHERKLMALNEVFADASNMSAPIDSDSFETDSDNTTMSDDDNPDGTSPIDVGDLTVDALAAQNDAVADLQNDVAELQSELDSVKDERDQFEAELDAKDDQIESLEEELESFRADEKQELVSEITSLTDTWGEDELMELPLDGDGDTLEHRLELAKDIAADVGGTDVGTDDAGDDDGGDFGDYEYGEVYDLADTA